MITAVDTNVLIDIMTGDPKFGPGSLRTLRSCLVEGSLIACEVVWAEVGGGFATPDEAHSALTRLQVSFIPMDAGTALAAGTAWGAYRRRGGPRELVTSDFLIGAHALRLADRLLSRDRGFYRSYFQELTVVEPSTK